MSVPTQKALTEQLVRMPQEYHECEYLTAFVRHAEMLSLVSTSIHSYNVYVTISTHITHDIPLVRFERRYASDAIAA